MIYKAHYRSPLGDIVLASDEYSLIGLWIAKQRYIESSMPMGMIHKENHPILQEAIIWLNEYFSCKKPKLSRLSLAPVGGEFRQQVWRILTEIPYGELTTYGKVAKEVAKRMGKERMSAQAVGGAIGHNPISIIIPCHRVIGSDNSLTGYAGGIDMKIKLLQHEGVDMKNIKLI